MSFVPRERNVVTESMLEAKAPWYTVVDSENWTIAILPLDFLETIVIDTNIFLGLLVLIFQNMGKLLSKLTRLQVMIYKIK